MLDYIHILPLQNQHSNFVQRDSSFFLKPVAFVFVPDNVHDFNVLHYVYNVKRDCPGFDIHVPLAESLANIKYHTAPEPT